MADTQSNTNIAGTTTMTTSYRQNQTAPYGGLDPTIKMHYVRTLLENAEPKLVHLKYADEYPLPQGTGKRMEWRKFAKLPKALTPLVEGVTPVGNSLNMSTVEGEIYQYGDWIRLSDIVKLTALDNLIVQATKQLGSQAGRTLDTVARETLHGGTSVRYAPKSSGAAVSVRSGLDGTCLLTPDLLLMAATDLDAMDNEGIDGTEDYIAIVHPYAAYDLMRNEEWKDWQRRQNSGRLYDREVGSVGRVHVITTSEAKIWKDDTCPSGLAVFGTIVLAAHAYGKTELQGAGLEHIVKPLGAGEDPLNQRASVGWKSTLGVTRLNEDAMVRLEHCSKYSPTANAN